MSRTRHHRAKRLPRIKPERWCRFCNRVCWLMLEIHGVRYDDVGDRVQRFKQRRERLRGAD